MLTDISSLLTSDPQIRHGRLCITGSAITVHRIAILHNLGHSPEDIVRKYEHLTLAGVHAALACYYANKEKVDAEIVADETEAARIEQEFLSRQQQVA